MRSSTDLIDAKVRRIHIGTHSAEIEVGLRSILKPPSVLLCGISVAMESIIPGMAALNFRMAPKRGLTHTFEMRYGAMT